MNCPDKGPIFASTGLIEFTSLDGITWPFHASVSISGSTLETSREVRARMSKVRVTNMQFSDDVPQYISVSGKFKL